MNRPHSPSATAVDSVAAATGRSRVSRGKKRVFLGIVLGFSFLCMEVTSCIVLRALDQWYPMDPLAKITPDRVEGFLTKFHDPDLGWLNRKGDDINALGTRSSHEYQNLADTISVFGDSYTFCDGVPVADAWPTLLEEMVHCGILNFGVGGYGTDQALLRFEKMHVIVPSRTVLLCIQPENINRIVSTYTGFYGGSFGALKPYFTIDKGDLTLHNPFSSPDVIRDVLLNKPEKLIEICRLHDYWLEKDMLFGSPWAIRFPYTFQLAVRLPYVWGRLHIALTDITSHAHLYREGETGFELMKAIVRRFVAVAKAQNARPFILILPPPRDVARYATKGELNYEALDAFLKSEAVLYHDMTPTLAKDPDLYSLYVNKSGHYSRKGSEIIAAELAKFLRANDAIPVTAADNPMPESAPAAPTIRPVNSPTVP